MGIIMINCPKTERVISTGLAIDATRFNRSPVFFGRTYCPMCRIAHEWFARDAWISETQRAADSA